MRDAERKRIDVAQSHIETEWGKRIIIIIYVTTMEPPHPYGPKLQSKKKWPHYKTHLFLMMMSGIQSWNPNIVIKMEGFSFAQSELIITIITQFFF